MSVADSRPAWKDDTGNRVTRMPDAVHVCASGIVYNGEGEVLLENRADNGWWGLPGGHVDVGESVEQAAIREILEETGIRTRVRRLVGIYSDPQFNVIGAYSDCLIHFVVVMFECEYVSGELEVSEESVDVRYFPARKLPAKTLLCDVQAITDALENRIQPFIR